MLAGCFYPNRVVEHLFMKIHQQYFSSCNNEEDLSDAPPGVVLVATLLPIALIPFIVYIVVWKSSLKYWPMYVRVHSQVNILTLMWFQTWVHYRCFLRCFLDPNIVSNIFFCVFRKSYWTGTTWRWWNYVFGWSVTLVTQLFTQKWAFAVQIFIQNGEFLFFSSTFTLIN